METRAADYTALIAGMAPRGLALPDTPITSVEVLRMLAGVADRVWQVFTPASWLIVEQGEIVGLCSITRPPTDGVLDLGYGIAPSRRGRGIATRAIGEIVAWARASPDVIALTAETNHTNLPSQRVLAGNGFAKVGERVDEEDGPLICWRCVVE